MRVTAADVVRYGLCPRWYEAHQSAATPMPGLFVDDIVGKLLLRLFELPPQRRTDQTIHPLVRKLWAQHRQRKKVFTDVESERKWGMYALEIASKLVMVAKDRQPFSVGTSAAVDLRNGRLSAVIDSLCMKLTGTVRVELYRPRLFSPLTHLLTSAVVSYDSVQNQFGLQVDEVTVHDLQTEQSESRSVDDDLLSDAKSYCSDVIDSLCDTSNTSAGEHCVYCSAMAHCREHE